MNFIKDLNPILVRQHIIMAEPNLSSKVENMLVELVATFIEWSRHQEFWKVGHLDL